jgi:hypothetical protein
MLGSMRPRLLIGNCRDYQEKFRPKMILTLRLMTRMSKPPVPNNPIFVSFCHAANKQIFLSLPKNNVLPSTSEIFGVHHETARTEVSDGVVCSLTSFHLSLCIVFTHLPGMFLWLPITPIPTTTATPPPSSSSSSSRSIHGCKL